MARNKSTAGGLNNGTANQVLANWSFVVRKTLLGETPKPHRKLHLNRTVSSQFNINRTVNRRFT